MVAGALVNGGRVLLCHRHPSRRWYPDVWDLPGGHLEAGEDLVTALRRELAEELGVVAVPEPWPLWRHVDDEMDLTVLRVRTWRGRPALLDLDEHDDLGWFTPDEAAELVLADGSYPTLLAAALATGPGTAS